MSVLKAINTTFPDLRGEVVVSCDNDEALRKGIEYTLWPKVQAPHYYTLSLLHTLRRQVPFHLISKEVRGHQDSKGSHDLNRLEVLNVIADEAVRTMAQNRTVTGSASGYQYSER